jgi:hypothetical protein
LSTNAALAAVERIEEAYAAGEYAAEWTAKLIAVAKAAAEAAHDMDPCYTPERKILTALNKLSEAAE